MKTFAERYTKDEFMLVNQIQNVLRMLRQNRFSGNYQPYQIRANNSIAQLMFTSTIANKELSTDMYLYNLKLDFAIQVWEIAQELTAQKYPGYANPIWIQTNDPINELAFDNIRKNAEQYFYQMLIEVCNDINITSSENASFKRFLGFHYNSIVLRVILNQPEINDEIVRKVTTQYCNGEKTYKFDIQNRHFEFDEIKDYFVFCDKHLLSLLNAEDANKRITELDKKLLFAADKSDLPAMINAVESGANINAVDKSGETAFTRVFRNLYENAIDTNDSNANENINKVITMAQKMLDMGADINFFGYDGFNALQYTAYMCNPALMKFLLNNGANPNCNYHPDDIYESVTSSPLNTILDSYYDDDYSDNSESLKQCETLLRNAGAY